EAHASVKEQRVVAVARRLGHSLRRGMRELGVVADDKRLESKAGIQLGRRDRRDFQLEPVVVAIAIAVAVAVVPWPVGLFAIRGDKRRAMAARRDHKVNADLGAGNGLESLLDEAGKTVLQPVLGELAGYADAKCAAVGLDDRRVLQPH